MKRPKSSGQHRAQSPARASNTMITACLIISAIIAAVLIVTVISLAGGNKRTIPNTPRAVARSSAPAAPLGGEPPSSGVPGHLAHAATTHILHDEPLEGGEDGNANVTSSSCKTAATGNSGSACPPQQRDRPAIEAMQNAVVEAQQVRERRIAVWRIDTYLAHKGSPMQGCGEYYIQNQERTGIPGALSAGIAEAESTNGMRCYQHPAGDGDFSHNAWGMVGWEYRNGFSSWQEGIAANFDFLMKYHGPGAGKPIPQTIHDCSGYCEGNTTNQTVDDVQWQINTYEPPEGK